MTNKMTTRDIAKLAGVSPTAVSFALNHRPGISDDTRQRILQIVEENNYRPVPRATRDGAASLRIAVIFPFDIRPIDRLFYTELNTAVMLACGERNYDMVFTHPNISPSGEIVLPEIIKSRNVDGVLVFGDISMGVIHQIRALNLPLVELDSSRTYSGQTAVSPDYQMAAYTATRHLIALGHRDVAYIGNDELHDFNLRIFSGFQQAATEVGLSLDLSRIQIHIHDEQSLYAAIDSMVATGTCPTAFFCATDLYAVHTMQRLHAAGIRVPEDISVIGVDDTIVSRFTIPPLSTVSIDRDALGRLGFELLQELIAGRPAETITLPSSDLILRASTAPPAR